ncbi:MAG TPA: hypothetical protein VES39_05550 [Rhodospirillales bacterium]|nr:hypothetical protein [Rhodospirillales bacterium]
MEKIEPPLLSPDDPSLPIAAAGYPAALPLTGVFVTIDGEGGFRFSLGMRGMMVRRGIRPVL